MSERPAVVSLARGFDEHRNTSRVFQPNPGDGLRAAAACREWGDAHWAHRQWIIDGAPRLTQAEHVARFGCIYTPPRQRKGKR